MMLQSTSSLVVFVAIGLCAAACGGETASAGSAEVEAVAVRVPERAEVEGREMPLTLELDGTLTADEESQVTSVVAGRVMEVLVERGATVAAGDAIVRLRDVDFRNNARAARAAVSQAEANLGMGRGDSIPAPEDTPAVQLAATERELARNSFRRAESLHRSGAMSGEAFEQAQARLTNAESRYRQAINGARAAGASLSSARAQLSTANTQIAESTVRAPFAGEIAIRNVSVGEYVSPQTSLVTLVRTNPLRIVIQVPQQNLLDVQPGQTVRLAVDAVPDRTFEGTIRYVSAAVDESTRGLAVEAVVPNTDNLLRPGLFASARIETERSHEVTLVPLTSVLTEAGVSRAFVIRGGAIEERVLAIAERRDEQAVVTSGLEPGDVVALGNLEALADGLSVEE